MRSEAGVARKAQGHCNAVKAEMDAALAEATQTIVHLYVHEKRSMGAIARELRLPEMKVAAVLKANNVEIRPARTGRTFAR